MTFTNYTECFISILSLLCYNNLDIHDITEEKVMPKVATVGRSKFD